MLWNNKVSKYEDAKCGVLQGSTLGDLLSIFYTSDMPNNTTLGSTPVAFANETNIIHKHTNLIQLQSRVENFDLEFLSMNDTKTVYY